MPDIVVLWACGLWCNQAITHTQPNCLYGTTNTQRLSLLLSDPAAAILAVATPPHPTQQTVEQAREERTREPRSAALRPVAAFSRTADEEEQEHTSAATALPSCSRW